MSKVGGTSRQFGNTPKESKPVSEFESAVRIPQSEIKVGSRVALKNFGSIGTIEKIENETAEVLVGAMRLREKLSNLEAIAATAPETSKKQGRLEKLQTQAAGSNLRLDTENRNAELNIIGKTTSEVEDLVDRFLDESYLSGFQTVRIVHGIGTGALRGAVHDFLRNHPHVSRYTLAHQNEGGNGATIVELKQ
jgi:DNA mismatch repair protein MutS2